MSLQRLPMRRTPPRGYVVRYLEHKQPYAGEPPSEPQEKTIILRGLHPLAWASLPPAIYRAYFFAVVTSWQEFDCPDHLWAAIDKGAILSAQDYSSRGGEDGDVDDDLSPALKAEELRRRRLLADYLSAEKGERS